MKMATVLAASFSEQAPKTSGPLIAKLKRYSKQLKANNDFNSRGGGPLVFASRTTHATTVVKKNSGGNVFRYEKIDSSYD
jgi:hypothetical protein